VNYLAHRDQVFRVELRQLSRPRQLAGLVAAAVEWGLNDGQVLALAPRRPSRLA
jgi:hypothetical protein